jgi:hypothetical protein
MQYQGFALFREDPVIGGMILEGELKGKQEIPALLAQFFPNAQEAQ